METSKTKAYMDRYVQEKKPDLKWDYWDAYRARRVNNHHCLLEFAGQLMKKGYECACSEQDFKDECVQIIYITKDGKETHAGFAEVPYRWYINTPYENSGLVKGLYIGEDTWNFPLEVDEVEPYLHVRKEKWESPYRHKLTLEDCNVYC